MADMRTHLSSPVHSALGRPAEGLENDFLYDILNYSQVGVWDWHFDTGALTVSASLAKILQYQPEDADKIAVDWERVIVPQDIALVGESMQQHLAGDSEFWEAEFRLRRRDGSLLWVCVHGKMVDWDENGRPLRIAGTMQDITRNKTLEESLLLAQKESQAHLYEHEIRHMDLLSRVSEGNDFQQSKVTLLEAAPFGCQLWDAEGHIITCNSALVQLFDLQSKQEFYEHFFELSPEVQPDGHNSKEKALHLLNQARVDGIARFEWLHRTLTGVYFPAEITLVRVPADDTFYVAGYTRDLRDVRSLESALRVRNSELAQGNALLQTVNHIAQILLSSEDANFDTAIKNVLEQLGNAAHVDRVYVWQNHVKEDGCLYCDQVYEWFEGAAPQQGTELTRDISYDDVIPSWREAFEAGRGIKGLVREMSQSEQEQLLPQEIVSIMVQPIILNQHVWGFIGLDDCRNERVWLSTEEAILSASGMLIAAGIEKHLASLNLRQAKEMAEAGTSAKSDFLARMSHEIRTPMNAVLGLLYLCLQTTLTDKQRDYLVKTQTAAQNLLGIINDILDFSKIEAQKLDIVQQPFLLSSVLENVRTLVNLKAQEKNLALACHVEQNVPRTLTGDAMRVHQVLLNLCSNAVKFTESGLISITVRLMQDMRGENWVLFSIKDTGCGLSQEEISRLFLPFSQMDGSMTRRYGGTGLGLVISKQLVELMGGSVGVESIKGAGSIFFFTLPCSPSHDFVVESCPQPESLDTCEVLEPIEPLTGYRVLLVEDNEINQIIAETLLNSVGLEVMKANNGEEACSLLKTERFDLVLMDIQMPVMDGLEATRRIRAMSLAWQPPILAMTAHAMESDKIRSLKAGMDDHITKPFEPNILFHILKKWLGQEHDT